MGGQGPGTLVDVSEVAVWRERESYLQETFRVPI